MKAKNTMVALVSVLILPVMTGCLYIPTKDHHSGSCRENIPTDRNALFKKGQTTRKEVLLRLGEPDAVSYNEDEYAYRTEYIFAYVPWIIPAYTTVAAGVGAMTDSRYFVVKFDALGKFEYIREGLGGFSPVMPELEYYEWKPVIFQEKVYWHPNVEGFRKMNLTGVEGVSSQLMLTAEEILVFPSSNFANAEPELRLPYGRVRQLYLSKYTYILYLREVSGIYHEFAFSGGSQIWSRKKNKPSTLVYTFLQKKVPKP